MKDFIILMCSVGAHILSSKGIALGLILLLFWIKGKQLGFNSEKWENYFLELSQKKVLRLTLGVSGIGIVGATLLSYMILNKTGFDYALMIAVIMLCCSVLWFWHKWKGEKGRDYVLKRFAEIPQTILEKREREAHIQQGYLAPGRAQKHFHTASPNGAAV